MSYRTSTLLKRNLQEVFGENDPARRRAAIEEIYTEDVVFYEPKGIYRGRDEIDRIAGAIKATHPDFRYQLIAEPEELGNSARGQWVKGTINHGAVDLRETYMASRAKHSNSRAGARPRAGTQEQDRLPDSTREDKIRRRAYAIYLERGREPGRGLEDWLEAERELATGESKAAGE